MDSNNMNRVSSDPRPAAPPINVNQPSGPPRPPLNRSDSRTSFPATSGPRPLVPPLLPQQQRPQFQAGGPVNNPPQYTARPGTPITRAQVPSGPVLPQQPTNQRTPVPAVQRPAGPQTVPPQLSIRPLQSPQGPVVQRAPPPNNLQFGPRQPSQLGVPTTPDGSKPLITQNQNGIRNGTPVLRPLLESQRVGQPPASVQRQPSQGSVRGPDITDSQKIKSSTLDNQNVSSDNFNVLKPENEIPANMAKNRSYSIAAAPGAPSPLKMEDDRRKSVSGFGGKIEELSGRSSGLGSINEKSGVHDSKESLKFESANINRDICDRPESRISGSKMTESFMGSLGPATPKKKVDDDDDVISQTKKIVSGDPTKKEILDRSPSLTRSDDSPETKQQSPSPMLSNRSTPKQSITPEPQRTKTPIENKANDYKLIDYNKEINSSSVANVMSKSPVPDTKPSTTPNKKPTELYTDAKKCATPRKTLSAKPRAKDGDNDSGVDESTQGNDINGSPDSPNKKTPSKLPTKEKSSNGLPTLSRSSSKSATAKTPETPVPTEKKKVPMNKVQVGNAPSPNLKCVKSKIGSLENSTYKPGGGKVKIENRKLDFQKATPRIAAKNETYAPSGGTKKISTAKLEWNAKSKIGSLQNSSYKPGGGDKKIETVKLDFKEKAKPKVASTVNITHKPGGGAVKIENQKLDFKAQSKVGSLDNVKHRPGGGDVKIFDDKDYIKNVGSQSPALTHSGQESPVPQASHPPQSDENLNQQQC